MKERTAIDMTGRGDDMDVWAVYADNDKSQLFGYIVDEDDAALVEDVIALMGGDTPSSALRNLESNAPHEPAREKGLTT